MVFSNVFFLMLSSFDLKSCITLILANHGSDTAYSVYCMFVLSA